MRFIYLSLAIFSLAALMSSISQGQPLTQNSAVQLKGRSSLPAREDFAPDHFINLRFQKLVPLNGGCSSFQSEFAPYYLDARLFEEYFTYDYMLACVPYDSTQYNVIVDLSLEAKSAESVAVLAKYLKSRQDWNWQGIQFHFESYFEIQTNRHLAVHLLKNSAKPIWTFELPTTSVNRYGSFAEYLTSVHRDASQLFQNPTMREVFSYLRTAFDKADFSEFSEYLKKGNYLTISIPRLMKSGSGQWVPGVYVDGVFRDCRVQDETTTCQVIPSLTGNPN